MLSEDKESKEHCEFLSKVSYFQSFPVRSLGWMEMAEQDLCEGRSSVAVHHCIRQLSYCRRDIRDSAGVWGEVKSQLIKDLEESSILAEPEEFKRNTISRDSSSNCFTFIFQGPDKLWHIEIRIVSFLFRLGFEHKPCLWSFRVKGCCWCFRIVC